MTNVLKFLRVEMFDQVLEMLEWKLVRGKVGIDRYNMNAYTQVATLTAIFRICYFLFITETPLRKYKLSGIYKWSHVYFV